MNWMFVYLAFLCVAPCLVFSVQTVVQTKYGPVEGYVSDDGNVLIFRSIPFAAPPIGNSRFTSPKPPNKWTTPKQCFRQAAICPQIYALSDELPFGQEDCLYLDVYVPLNVQTPAPVMNWIYGGGYVFGDSYEFGWYDGTNFASKRGVILVMSNYRLGPLGFLALDQLRLEDPYGSTGNYGHQDQRFAMEWIRDNIANFGGDPHRVTIFGESAGAFSVCWHLVSPKSKGLFRAAIMQSGTCEEPSFFRPYEDARSFSESWTVVAGCNPQDVNLLKCLRAKPVATVMGILGSLPFQSQLTGFVPALYPFMPWGAAIDGTEIGLLKNPLTLMKQGNYNKVPLLIGSNQDEATIFIPAMYLAVPDLTFPMVDNDVNVLLNHFFKNMSIVNAVRRQYPMTQYKSYFDNVGAILRDYFFACSARRILNTMAPSGLQTFLYHFTYAGDWIEQAFLGDYHTAELALVFDNEWPPIIHAFTDNDKQMADVFGTYWSNFVKYLDPNGLQVGRTQPFWPAYDPVAQMNIKLQLPVQTERKLLAPQCEFWDAVDPYVINL